MPGCVTDPPVRRPTRPTVRRPTGPVHQEVLMTTSLAVMATSLAVMALPPASPR